jgi:hypothetical protein
MPNTPPQLVAGGTIYPHRFVTLSTDAEHEGVQATANSKIIGITGPPTKFPPLSDLVSDNPAAEEFDSFLLKGEGEICLVEAGAACTAGIDLKADSDGKAVASLTTGTVVQQIGAVSLQAAAADGDLIKVQVRCQAHLPAVS